MRRSELVRGVGERADVDRFAPLVLAPFPAYAEAGAALHQEAAVEAAGPAARAVGAGPAVADRDVVLFRLRRVRVGACGGGVSAGPAASSCGSACEEEVHAALLRGRAEQPGPGVGGSQPRLPRRACFGRRWKKTFRLTFWTTGRTTSSGSPSSSSPPGVDRGRQTTRRLRSVWKLRAARWDREDRRAVGRAGPKAQAEPQFEETRRRASQLRRRGPAGRLRSASEVRDGGRTGLGPAGRAPSVPEPGTAVGLPSSSSCGRTRGAEAVSARQSRRKQHTRASRGTAGPARAPARREQNAQAEPSSLPKIGVSHWRSVITCECTQRSAASGSSAPKRRPETINEKRTPSPMSLSISSSGNSCGMSQELNFGSGFMEHCLSGQLKNAQGPCIAGRARGCGNAFGAARKAARSSNERGREGRGPRTRSRPQQPSLPPQSRGASTSRTWCTQPTHAYRAASRRCLASGGVRR